jgi:hypothetical protein
MKVVYLDFDGNEQLESDCDGPGCEVRFSEGLLLLIGVTTHEGREVPEGKVFCSHHCMRMWKIQWSC